MSEDIPLNQNKSSTTAPVRFRSRFPKAQPNLAVSSGLARIRRISGHFPDKKESENNEKVASSPSTSNSLKIVENILSPKITTEEEEATKSLSKPTDEFNPTIQSPNLTFKQLINSQTLSPAYNCPVSNSNSIPGSPSSTIPAAVVLETNAQIYKPQFSKEHIMNIIKYKAMQKLKKIESENLKEKRKKNKKSSILFKSVNEQSVNQNQNGEKFDKSKLRMKDFLYYNPKRKSDSSETVLDGNNEQKLCSISRSNSSISLALNSENDTNDTPESVSSKSSTVYSFSKPAQPAVSLAPQLRISEDGTIVINEESLVIQRQEPEPVYESTVVESEYGDNLTYNSYRKFHHTKKWTERETAKFYKALSMVGTDFTMIQKFFSYRNRDEIKRKFKREEKINQALIDKILSKTVSIDLSFFVSSSGEEDEKNEIKSKKSKNLSLDRINQSNSSNSLNENEAKKKPKLKRIQKRTFIESESESELSNKKKSSDTHDTEQNKEKAIALNAQTNLEIDSNFEKLPPCTSLFENNNQTLEVINEQIIRESNEAIPESDDNESIELVFDLDNQIINEKRNRDTDQMDNEVDSNENEDGEIILDLDNNTIIHNSNWGASSISIQKLNDTDKL